MLNNIEDWKNAPLWTIKKIKFATKDWFKYEKKLNRITLMYKNIIKK